MIVESTTVLRPFHQLTAASRPVQSKPMEGLRAVTNVIFCCISPNWLAAPGVTLSLGLGYYCWECCVTFQPRCCLEETSFDVAACLPMSSTPTSRAKNSSTEMFANQEVGQQQRTGRPTEWHCRTRALLPEPVVFLTFEAIPP